MVKYYILEILQTQAFDVIIAVVCIIPFYFLMKMHIRTELKKIRAEFKKYAMILGAIKMKEVDKDK